MRAILEQQLSLVPRRVKHEHADALGLVEAVLAELLAERGVGSRVHEALTSDLARPTKGRRGMSCREVVTALVIKQMTGFSYRELAFHLADSDTYRRMMGYGVGASIPSAQTLQRNIKKLSPESLRALNDELVRLALDWGIEAGETSRVDCTVTETNIHEPADSTLLDDCVRVLTRQLRQADALVRVGFTDHTKRARRRTIAIRYARKPRRTRLYKDLITVAERTVRAAECALTKLQRSAPDASLARVISEFEHYIPLAKQVIAQSRRRVLQGESVPVADKVVSIFEAHTDIIRKGGRETHYGHKLCLANGPSGLFTDCTIEEGNPADSVLAVKMVKRHIQIFGNSPKQIAFDGGFASKSNLTEIKALGVGAVAFSKKCGLTVTEMVGSSRLYRVLRNFRAGVEAWISCLKRAFGLTRCNWRGSASFRSYVWASVIAANLLTIARLQAPR